jgi:hypothetical protein
MRTAVLTLALLIGLALAMPDGILRRGTGSRASPHEILSAVVDGSRISINYGRPYKKGREIWGAVRPWDTYWMPGADEATIITTDRAVVLGGLEVPAGQHTLYLWLDPDASKLIVNNQVGQFCSVYDAKRDLGRVDLALRMLDAPVQQLTFAVEPAPAAGGSLKLSWDDREYSALFTVKR